MIPLAIVVAVLSDLAQDEANSSDALTSKDSRAPHRKSHAKRAVKPDIDELIATTTGPFQYVVVLSQGPLIIFRHPMKVRPRRPALRKALSALMKSFGLRERDVSGIECLLPEPDASDWSDPVLKARYTTDRAKFEAAYAGDINRFAAFRLYDWQDDHLVLVREGRE